MAKTVDLRTYLLLERAFVRRLQRSWRMLSAPTYALITQACLDHKWDEARRLVPELDMTEVGTENREWITYMLLSCAVFGAGTVRKGRPSFVGVGTFDTFLKQVTNNILTYLELSATAQVQEEALQSIAEDEAKTKAQKREYVRDKAGRFAETEGDTAQEESTDTAIGLIHRGVVRVRDLKGRDPYASEHRQLWMTDAFATERFRYNRGRIVWLDTPNAEDYFAVENHFVHRGWPVIGHFGQTRGNRLPEPTPTLKWDEHKHPRDKEGQFAATGATTEVLDVTDPEGSGPERLKWRTLSREAGEAFDVFMEAKTAHRANVNKATDRLEEYSKTHPDASVEEIEAEIWSDPEYLRTKKIAQAAEKAKNEADARLRYQEPEMMKEIVRNVAYGVAVDMGVDPYIISVVHKNPPEFMVGERQFTEAGHYTPSSRLIELNAKNIGYADTPMLKGLVSHEVSHFIYHRLKDEVERESERYKMQSDHYHDKKNAWFYERFNQPGEFGLSGYGPITVKPEWRERVEQEFPASAVWSKLSGGEMFTGISDEMKAENGHSAYAKSYWEKSAVNKAGSYDQALNETVAEDTRHLVHEKNKGKGGAGWHEPSKPSPDSQWLAFTKAMHTWYLEGSEFRRAGVERIRAEYAKRKAI